MCRPFESLRLLSVLAALVAGVSIADADSSESAPPKDLPTDLTTPINLPGATTPVTLRAALAAVTLQTGCKFDFTGVSDPDSARMVAALETKPFRPPQGTTDFWAVVFAVCTDAGAVLDTADVGRLELTPANGRPLVGVGPHHVAGPFLAYIKTVEHTRTLRPGTATSDVTATLNFSLDPRLHADFEKAPVVYTLAVDDTDTSVMPENPSTTATQFSGTLLADIRFGTPSQSSKRIKRLEGAVTPVVAHRIATVEVAGYLSAASFEKQITPDLKLKFERVTRTDGTPAAKLTLSGDITTLGRIKRTLSTQTRASTGEPNPTTVAERELTDDALVVTTYASIIADGPDSSLHITVPYDFHPTRLPFVLTDIPLP